MTVDGVLIATLQSRVTLYDLDGLDMIGSELKVEDDDGFLSLAEVEVYTESRYTAILVN